MRDEKKQSNIDSDSRTNLSLRRQAAQQGYTSQWQRQLDDTMGKIMNREKFTYDLNGDALWNQYKDQYVTGGKMAMMDTMGQAAALTGGYGNSYAQGVGQQAYQGYLQGLNDKIPELYQLALDSYNREGDALMQQYGMMLDRENTDYARWTDQRNHDYQVSRDQADDAFRQEQFEYQQAQDQADRDYQAQRDAANVAFRNQQLEYQQTADQRNHDYMVSQDQADRDYQAQQDARNMALAMLEAGTMPSAEMLAAAGLTNEFVGALYPQLMPGAAGSAGGAGDLTIDRSTKWYTNDDYLDWVGSAQGSAWQSTSQGRAWLYDTVLPTVSSYYDAGESSAAREVLMAMGLTQASIAEVERMYDESKQMS